jgi:hypothetical protein
MSVHQMQRHLELSEQRASLAGAALLKLEFENVDLMALNALLRLSDEPVGLCKMSVSVTRQSQTSTPPAADAAAEAAH